MELIWQQVRCFLGGRMLTGDLHVAAWEGDTVSVRRLLDRGANVDAVGSHRHRMIQGADGEFYLSKKPYGLTALAWAVRAGQIETTRLLIERGADVNYADGEGITILMWAAKEGNEALLRLLIKCGADVDARDTFGLSAVNHAIDAEHEGVANVLREAKA